MPQNMKRSTRVTVYALSSSAKKSTVRYVGQTTATLEERLSWHTIDSSTKGCSSRMLDQKGGLTGPHGIHSGAREKRAAA